MAYLFRLKTTAVIWLGFTCFFVCVILFLIDHVMISGNTVDLPDSQESIFKANKNFINCNDESNKAPFTDIWQDTISDVPNLLDLDKVMNNVIKDMQNSSNDLGMPDTPNGYCSGDDALDQNQISNEDNTQEQLANCVESSSAFPVLKTSSDGCFLDDVPGLCQFEIRFVKAGKCITKSIRYTYSKLLNKLFVQRNEICPVLFKCVNNPPPGSFIKVMPYFKNSLDSSDIVKTCLLHNTACVDNEQSALGHLVQAHLPSHYSVTKVIYDVTEEGQKYVLIPCDELNECGREHFTVRFKFTCLSSCKSGINRRPTVLVFCLQSPDGFTLGRRVVDLCICTRPGRDRIKEENKISPLPGKVSAVKRTSCSNFNHSEKVRKEADDNDVFYLKINGRHKYEKLLAIKQAFDLEEMVSDEQRQRYFQEQEYD